SVSQQLTRYVDFARNKLGWAADSDMAIGTEAVEELERLCREVHLRFPRSVFFAGQLIFREPTWWQRLLHNETAHTLRRRLGVGRLACVVLPVRVLTEPTGRYTMRVPATRSPRERRSGSPRRTSRVAPPHNANSTAATTRLAPWRSNASFAPHRRYSGVNETSQR